MTVLGTSILKDLVAKCGATFPSDEGAFDGDDYVVTVREDRTFHYLEHMIMIPRGIAGNERTPITSPLGKFEAVRELM